MINKIFIGIKRLISAMLGTDDVSLFLGSDRKYPLCEISTAYTASNIAASTVEATATSNTVTWKYTCVVTHVDCSTTTTTGNSSSSVTFSQNTTNSQRTISGNISWNGITIPYSFNQKGVPAYTAPTAANPTYNGSAQALVNAGSTSHGTIQYSSDGTNWGVTIPSATTAGSYTVQWKIIGDSTHSDLPAQTINVTISKVTPTVTPPTAKSLTYNGNNQQLANAGSTNFGTLKYCLTSGGTYTTSIPSGNTAGSYTLWYRVDGDSNVNNVAATSIACSISKAAGNVSTKPTAKGLTYNGNAQALVNAGSGTGTMMYKLDSGAWGTSIPSGTNATSYTVYYKASASTNYNESASGSVSVTINKVTPTVTAPTAKSLTYNGSAQQLANTGSTNFGTLQYSLDNSTYSTSVPSGTNATSYTVYYRVVGDSNINSVAAASISCSIAKANPTYTAPTAKTGLTYNGNAQALLNAGSTSHGTIQYSSDNSTWSTAIPNGTNASTSIVVYWRLIGDSNHNNVNSTSITCSIAKANPTYTAPTAKTGLTYNGNAQALLNAGSTSHGTIRYSSDNSTWSTSIPSGTNATSYTSYWKLDGDSNHNSVASTSISTTISKVTPTVTAPTAKSLTYNGSAQQLANAGSTNFGTLQYSLDNSTYGTSVPSGTNATSYTVYYRVVGNSNVNDVAAKSISCLIGKANPTYTAPTAKTGLTYNGNDQALLNAGSTSHGTIRYSSDNSTWSTAIPSGKTAGSYTSYWKLDGDSNHNSVASTSISTTLSKAAGNVSTKPTAKSLTFNNANQALVNAGSGTGTMMYKLDSGAWGTSIPSASAATSYTVYYKASASTNYNESASGSVSVTINKVTPTVTAPTAKVLTFNNANQVLANAGSTNYGTIQYCLNNSGGTYSTTVPSASAANVTYKVWYKIVGNSNVNDVAPASIDCSIAEKRVTTPTITLDPSSYTYSGSQCKPTPTVKDGSTVIPSSEYTVSYSNNTNAGTATVTISDVVAGNYYISGTTTFTINKAAGSVTTAPTAKSLTFNNANQALVNAGNGTGTIMYKLDGGSWGTSIPSASAATSYTVYYKASASTNYNESASGSVSVTINKVTPTVTAPTAKSLTYNGSAQALVSAGSTNYGTLQYSSDNTNWSTSIPSGTNATSYTVYYRVVGNSNVNDVAAKSVSCSIGKADTTYTAPTAKNTTYNTSAQALLNAGAVTGGTIYYSSDNTNWSTTIPSQTNAGTYTTYWKITGDSNHNDKASASISTTISAKTVSSPTITLSQTAYTYSNSACQPTPTVKDGTTTTISSGEYTVSYSNNVNVGTATCTITDKSGGNYTVSGSKTFTINCYSATAPTAKSLTYNTASQQLANAGSTAYGTMVYCSTSGGTFSTSIPSGTNAGSYEVWWKVTGNTNVCNTTATKVACSIGAKTVSSPTITLSPSSYVYSNSACQPTPTVKDGSTTIASSEYTVSYSNNVNAGTATCTITDKSGGNYTVSGSKTFTISKYTPTAPTAKNPNWTGSAQNLVNAGSTSYGTMVYSTTSGGTYSTTIPQGTNAGSYEVWWKVTGNTNVNNTEPTKISCSINKVAMSYTAPSGRTLNYSGSGQALMTGGAATGGSIQYSTSSTGTYSTTVPTQTNAGTYTTWWKAVPDSNHSGGTNAASASTTINKVAMTYTAPKVTTYTYANTARALVSGASANGGSIQYCATSGGTYSTTVPTQTNVGTYDTWWKAVPDGNHSGGTSAAKLTTTINCYSATAPTAKNPNWTGSAQALVNAGSTSYGTVVYSTDNSTFNTTIPSGTSAGSYTVYWKVTGNTNVCQTTSASISCSIKQVAMSYTAPSAATRTYTGSAQQIVSGGSANGGSIYYATSNAGASSSTTVPSQTNAGTYTVYWKAVPDGNHSGGTSSWAAISCTIAKAAMTYSAPKAAVRTYNGSAQQIVSGQSAAGGSIYYATSSAGASSSTTVPTQTNTGTTYSTYWKAVPDGNHSGGTSTWAQVTGCTINKATLTITAKNQTVNYGTAITTGTGQVTTSGLVGGDSLTAITLTQSTTNVPGGTITPSAGATTKGIGNYSVTYNTGTLTINKVAMTYTAPKAAVRTYNGSAQQIVSGQSAGGGSIQFCSTSGGTYTTTVPTQTNASTTYSTWWKAVPDGNHSGGTSAAQITGCTINKAAGSVTTAPTAKSLTFNNANQALVNAGSGTGTMLYTAGYDVTLYTEPDGSIWKRIAHHNNPASNGVFTSSDSFSIGAYRSANLWFDVNTMVNGLSSFEFMVKQKATSSASEVKYRWIQSKSPVSAAYEDVAPAKVTRITTAGYTDGSYGGLYILNSSSYMVIANTSKGNWFGAFGAWSTYNGGIPGYPNTTITNGYMDLYVRVTSAGWSSTVPARTSVGGYVVAYKASASTNYNESASGSVSVTINKVTPTVTAPTAKSLTYNGSAQQLANAGSTNYGTLQYSSDNTNWGSSIPSGTNATSYTVYYRVIGNNNINDKSSVGVSCSIGKKTGCAISFATTAITKTYGNAAFTNTATNNGDSTITWSSSNTGVCTVNSSGQVTIVKAGSCTITATVANTSNCTYSTTAATYNITVNKASQSAPTATGATVTYHNTATATASGGGGQGTLTWTNGNTRTATGTTTTAAYWAGNSNYNASPNSNSVNLVVNKATDQSITVTLTNRTYNGSGQVVASATAHGISSYYLGFGSSNTSAPTSWGSANTSLSATNAGTYYVWYKGTADGNHSSDISATYKGTVTVAKAAMSYTAPSAATRTYNNSAQQIVSGGSANGGNIYYATSNAGANSGTTVPSQTNAGTYTVYWKAVPDGNHSGGTSSWAAISCTIAKANQSAPTATGASVTYGSTATATASGGGGQGSIEWSNGNTLTGNVGSKTTKARWSGNSNYNASNWSNEVTLAITRANRTVNFTSAPTPIIKGNTGTVAATASAGGSDGTMSYSSSNTSIATVNGTTITGVAAGQCTITATISQGTNYNSASKSYTLNIVEWQDGLTWLNGLIWPS